MCAARSCEKSRRLPLHVEKETLNRALTVNVVKLLSGRMATQIVSLVAAPILTRLFLPTHFGVIQIFDSVAAILIAVAGLKYELAIPLARDDREAFVNLTLSAGITLLATMLLLLIVGVGHAQLAGWFHAPELRGLFWFLPLVVFVGSFEMTLGYWAARESQFGLMAWADWGRTVAERLLPIGWGLLLGASVMGLLLPRIVAPAVSIGLLLLFLRRKLGAARQTTQLTLPMLWAAAQQHKKFPGFSAWAELLNAISVQLLPFFFGAYFSTAAVGYYALAYNVISLPLKILRSAIGQVFFPAAAKEYQQFGSLDHIVRSVLVRLVQISVFPMVAVSLFGPELFTLIFGRQWTEAGVYAQIIVCWQMLAFLNFPLRIFEIVNRQEADLVMNGLLTAGRIVSLLPCALMITPRTALSIFTGVSVCGFGGYLAWKLRLARVSIGWALALFGKYVGLAAALLVPVKIIAWIVSDFRIGLGLLGLAAILYGAIVFHRDQSIRAFLRSALCKSCSHGNQKG